MNCSPSWILFCALLCFVACDTSPQPSRFPRVAGPPPLPLYREASRFSLTSENATCLTSTSDNRIIVGASDVDAPALVVYRSDGTQVASLRLDVPPQAVAVVKTQNLPAPLTEKFAAVNTVAVVAFKASIAFYDLDAESGKPLLMWAPLDEKSLFTSIAVGTESIFVGDAGHGVIVAYSGDGEVVATWGKRRLPKDVAAGEFTGFTFYAVRRLPVAISPTTGLLYAANPGRHRVEVWTQDGNWEEPLGWGDASTAASGFCGCCNPIDIAFLSSGDIVTAEKGLTRVKVTTPRGVYRGMVANVESFSTQDGSNFPHQNGSGPSRPRRDGGRSLQIDPSRVSPAKLRDVRPLRIAVTQTDDVLVLDSSEKTVRRFVAIKSE
ncbi:MAG: hypothetical protein ACRC46_12960 [Thermoguttaceae bacterium]